MNRLEPPPPRLTYDPRNRRLVRPAPVLTRRPDPPMPGREYQAHERTLDEHLRHYRQDRQAKGLPIFAANAAADHESAVAEALKKGLPVDDRVLADYSHMKRLKDPYR